METRTWYIGFCDYSGENRFFRLFTRKGFGHVFAFAQAGNFVSLVDPMEWGLNVTTLYNVIDLSQPLLAEDYAQLRLEEAAQNNKHLVVIKVDIPQYKKKTAHCPVNYLPTCVTLVKALLGHSSWSLTPYGLYCELLGLGAQRILLPNCQ